MTLAIRRRTRATAAFTLLEMVVALTIFTAVGYGLVSAIDAGNHSQRTIMRVAEEDKELRATTTTLSEEIKSSSNSTITITTLADGNSEVRFQQPIDVAGIASWGVYDRTLGPDAASQNRAGWSVRYTVVAAGQGHGTVNRQLVRQVLDDAQTVQRQKVIADGLCSGTNNPPGFRMVPTGDLWEITISSNDLTAGSPGIRAVFHVQTRN